MKANKQARFPEGKSVDVPKYLEEHGNPEAAEKWKEMNEEYGDLLKTATGEGTDPEWMKWLEKEMKTLASRSGGLVQLLEVRAFDQYQGPYARIRVKNLGVFKVWTLDEGFYIPDFPIVNTSSSEKPGYKADDLFDLRDGIKQAVKESMRKKASISPKTRAGTRVVVNGNPVSRILYGRHPLPPDGTMGTVTLMALPGGKRTYLPGPGGGLIYVDFDNGVTMGVAPQDLDLIANKKQASRPLYEIAREIRRDWGSKVNFAAKPYLEAMSDLNKITDMYMQDSGESIVAYFLSNASSWKGEKAKEIKAELKAMLKSGGKSAMSELAKMARLEDESVQEMEQMLADYEEEGTNTNGDDRHPELDEGSLIPGIQERLAFDNTTSTLEFSFEKIHGFFWGLSWMSPEQDGPDPKDYKDIEKAYKILVIALKDPIAGGLVKHYLKTYDHLGGAYTNASMPPTGVTIKQKASVDATPLKAAGWVITETNMGRVVWNHPETDVTFMTSTAERAVVVSLGATRILKQPDTQGIDRMASKHLAELERLAGRWTKNHERAIDRWLEAHPNYRGPDDWDSMPRDLTMALERIGDYESLWSDGQRYFSDQLTKRVYHLASESMTALEILAGNPQDDKFSRFEEGKSVDPTKNMNPEDAKKWKQQNEAHRNEFKTAVYTEDEFGETFAIGIPVVTASVEHQASEKVAFNQTDSDFVEWAINQPPMTKAETVMVLKKAGIKDILPPREKRQGPRFQEGDEVLISASKHTDSMTKDVYDDNDKKVGKVVGLEDLGVYVQFKSGQPVFFPDAQKPRGVGIYKWIAPFDMQGSSKLEAIYESGKPANADRIVVVQQYLNRGKSEPRKAPYFTGHAFNARFNKSGGVYFTMLPQQRLHVDPNGESTEAGFDATSINPEVGNLYYLGIFGKRPAKWEMELESMRSQARAIAASTNKTAGYTNYWNVLRDFTDAEWAEIITKAKQIIAKAAMTKTIPGDVIMVSSEVEAYVAEHGIQVAGPMGKGSPRVDKKVIALNGVAILDQDHESFVLYKSAKENEGYDFCKTARKPYDAVVASILWWAQKIAPDAIKVRRDGGDVKQVLARNPSDDKLSRFEEGKSADPTKNMSPEDKAKWDKQKEEHKDEFKAAYTSYKGDPFWMKAKYPGKADDGTPFKKGDDILYWPRTKTIMVGKKAEREWADFRAHAEDEDTYMSQYPSDRYAKEAAQAPTGLYGFTRRVQADCETCARKLTKQAKTIAKRIYAKDEQVAPFLATHAKRGNSLSAKVLMAAMQDLGPKFAKQAGLEGHHHFEGGKWYVDSNFVNTVQHVYPGAELVHMGMGEFYLKTPEGRLDFDRMHGVDFEGQVGRSHRLYDDAQGKVIDKAIKLMNQHNKSVKVARAGTLHWEMSRDFTDEERAAMQDLGPRFEKTSSNEKDADFPHYWLGKRHWDVEVPVTPEEVIPEEIAKTAAARTYGLYGFGSKTANLGITACAELREAAGILASDLHHRRADSHEHITGFLKQHAKEAGCVYSKMLHEAYPEASMKVASQGGDWITWEE